MIPRKLSNFLKVNFKKILFGFFTVLAIVSISLSSINWSGAFIIYSTGSSTVMPLLTFLGNNYNGSENLDLIVESGGSGLGIQSIVKNTKDIGNISRSPKISEAGSPKYSDILGNPIKASLGKYSKQWKKNAIKTITVGWDGICLVYRNPPTNNEVIDVNNETIAKIYELFAGNKALTFNDINPNFNSNITLIPFARTGGSSKSGTAFAFANDNNLNFNVDADTMKTLDNGNYGKDVKLTNESNVEVWKQISSQENEGVITYLSTGFVLKNWNLIEEAGFKVSTYNKIQIKEDTISSGYNWYRPLNLLVNLEHNSRIKQIKEFINWIFSSSSTHPVYSLAVKKSFSDAGIIFLNENQINSMSSSKNNFWASDYDLIKERHEVKYGALN